MLSLALLASPALSLCVNAEQDEAQLYTVRYFRDEAKTEQAELDSFAAGETVYYTVDLKEGCFYTTLATNAQYTDDDKMIFGEGERTVEVDALLAGDMNGDAMLDTRDLVRGMKYIAGQYTLGDISNDGMIAFDSNFDGEINVKDIVRAMKLLSGMQVELNREVYHGAKLEYTEIVRYSAFDFEAISSFDDIFHMDTITTVDDFNAYLEVALGMYDYDADLVFAGDDDAVRYEGLKVDVEELRLRYDEGFFANHSLIVATIYSVDEMTGPYLEKVIKNADSQPMLMLEYRWDKAGEEPVGAISCLAHHFIETEKFEESSETDASGNPLAGWYFIKGLVA